MKKMIFILSCMFLLSLSIVFAGTDVCTYTSGTNSTDFFSMNTSNYVQLNPVGANIKFGSLTNITPRLNFTVQINETYNFSSPGGYMTLNFKEINNTSTVMYNSTGGIVPATNYSVINSTATYPRTFIVNNLGGAYTNKNVTISYNRTFVKNVDNLAGIYAYDICGNGCVMTEINTSAAYGDAVGWRLVASPMYSSNINGSNFATEWTYTSRSCISDTKDTCNGIFSIISNSFSFASIAILILVVSLIIGALVSVATTDIKMGIMSVIFSSVLMLVGYIVITKVYMSIC